MGICLGLIRPYFEFDLSISLAAPLLVVMFLRFKNLAIIYLLALLFCYNMGQARSTSYRADLDLFNSLLGSRVQLTGVVSEDLSYHKSGQREFHIQDLELKSPKDTPMNGRLRVRSYSANNLYRGDKILVEGRLNRALGNRHGTIQYAQVQKVKGSSSLLERMRLQFFADTHSAIPDPQSSLGLGFLVGVGNMLPDELDENLRTDGLTHRVAVSGYNLTILILLTRRIMANASKRTVSAAAVTLIIVFLALTGAAPSIVRAAIVSMLSLSAWYYGRTINPLVLLLVSATISAMINPYYLWKDIGWYLSFAAFFGVIVLAPLVTKRLFKSEPKIIGQLLIETCCAQLLTLPIIAYFFGDISIISVLANLMVLPLVPMTMALTFLAGVSGSLLPDLAVLIALPARYLLSYIVEVANLLAKTPNAVVKLSISLPQLAMSYGLIAFLCLILYKTRLKTEAKNQSNKL